MTEKGDRIAGYSGKPIWQKIGVKPGSVLLTRNTTTHAIPDYCASLPFVVTTSVAYTGRPSIVHIYADDKNVLYAEFSECIRHAAPGLMVWISWPKRVSKIPTDITEDTIREIVLPLGWVDVKVCSVTDELWSGLKILKRRS